MEADGPCRTYFGRRSLRYYYSRHKIGQLILQARGLPTLIFSIIAFTTSQRSSHGLLINRGFAFQTTCSFYRHGWRLEFSLPAMSAPLHLSLAHK